MKKLILLGFAILLFTSCENKVQQRYTQSSTEIDQLKAAIAAYESSDWEAYMSLYADTAKIYRNSDTLYLSPKANVDIFKEQLADFSSYGFKKDSGDSEMVITDKDETWVNFWGTWQGTLVANNKQVDIPLHITAQFIDGKIVKQYGYWDSGPLMTELMEIEAAKAATEEAEEE